LTDGKKRHDVQLCHSFRKYRETQLFHANLKEVDINILQGHANGGMVDHYYRPSADPNNRIDDYLINEFLKAEKFLIVDQKDKEITEIRKELDKKHEEIRNEIQADTNKQIEELRKDMEYQRQIMIKAAAIKDKQYNKLLKDPEILITRDEIENQRIHQTGPHPHKIEEGDFLNPLTIDISNDDIGILIANELLKINELGIGGNVYDGKQIMEVFKTLIERNNSKK
jgi:hypothetical protein